MGEKKNPEAGSSWISITSLQHHNAMNQTHLPELLQVTSAFSCGPGFQQTKNQPESLNHLVLQKKTEEISSTKAFHPSMETGSHAQKQRVQS